MTITLAVAIAVVMLTSSVVLLWQFRTGALLSPEERRIRKLRALSNGRKLR